MRMLHLLLATALLAPACRRPAPSPLHFCREEVNLRVQPGVLEVDATYHFISSAPNPVTAVIAYPFPLDSLHSWPDSIVLHGRTFARSDSGITFPMRFASRAEDSFRVWYRQPLRGRAARYIVTTTRQWRRPIDLARFSVTVPAVFEGVGLSYQPDSTTKTDSLTTRFFARKRFYPSEDVVVTWTAP